MPALRRLRKPAIWTAAAVLLLVLTYTGGYYRVVSRANALEAIEDLKTGTVQFRRVAVPVYTLPWPLTSQFNQPWVRQKLHAMFEPMNRLDRCLRPNVWKDEERVVTRAAMLNRR